MSSGHRLETRLVLGSTSALFTTKHDTRHSSLLNARFILGSYYELRPPKSVARERYASVLQYKHTGCGGRGDLKTGQHARQAARRASHDTQERRLSFRYTRESVKVLCCVTTPAPYAVGRSMCMHLSKHLSPSPFAFRPPLDQMLEDNQSTAYFMR